MGGTLPQGRIISNVAYDNRTIPPAFVISYASTVGRDAVWRNVNGGFPSAWSNVHTEDLPADTGFGSVSLNPYDADVYYAVALTDPVTGYVSFDQGDTWQASFD
jgi:hypothetical protein